jgi:hypothetical protein
VRGPSALPEIEAIAQVAAFRRLVQEAAREPLSADPEENEPVRIAARRLGLLYPRKGRLLATNKAREAARDPLALRTLMIREILRRRAPAHPLGELFLLAIADGSIADRDRALAVVAAGYDACMSQDDRPWGHGYGSYPFFSRNHRSSKDEVERSFESFAEVLAPLGLTQAEDGTLTVSPALVDFAKKALQ